MGNGFLRETHDIRRNIYSEKEYDSLCDLEGCLENHVEK